ncbi:hypothetical protein NPIL_19731 [Nephila pilipes]|uniref:Uncharacterized protein n=1 Tax=Nephila pilipes TaxID=299642 RepID=A0A8X6PNQ3_NEPPI|nr:hypothetical protein NPIL_19731 [Nephila pilipes]
MDGWNDVYLFEESQFTIVRSLGIAVRVKESRAAPLGVQPPVEQNQRTKPCQAIQGHNHFGPLPSTNVTSSLVDGKLVTHSRFQRESLFLHP